MSKLARAPRLLRHYYLALGFSGVVAIIIAKFRGTHPLFKTKVTGIKHPIFVRIATTDASVLRQVLREKHYDIPCVLAPKLILDAGANIGLSAVFFANKYPDATIIAVEPESSNFRLLKKNVSPYPQIKPLQAALWKENGRIKLIDPHKGHHGFQTVEGNANGRDQPDSIDALTVESILLQMGLPNVDLLKIDIEGSEKEVFENSANWIEQVAVIMAELHDNLKPGCSKSFADATKNFPLELLKGETVIRMRQDKAT